MMVPLSYYLFLSTALFSISMVGILLHRKNVIFLLICIELLLLAVNTNFVAFANHLNNVSGQVFVFFILTVAAAEAAVGLAIVMLLFRNRNTVDIDKLTELKG